jgi:hypothetical protein
MTTNETCPHCGAVQSELSFGEWCVVCLGELAEVRSKHCYKRELAAKSAKIKRLETVLTNIAEHGGTTDGESGLSHNGSWCAEQARCALEVE